MDLIEEIDIKRKFELFISNDKKYNKAIDDKIEEIVINCKKLNININIDNLKEYINKNFEKYIFDNLDVLFNIYFTKINMNENNFILTPFYMTFIIDDFNKSQKNNNSLKLLKDVNSNLIKKINNMYKFFIFYIISEFIISFYWLN